MRTLSLSPRVLSAIALAALVVACDKESKLPTSPGPTSPAAPYVTGVELSGPAAMAPGESAQFAVSEHLSDGSRRVAASIRWIASPPSFLQVDASGLVTAGSLSGGAVVTADVTTNVGVKRVSKDVLVQPSGTYFVTGTVSDAEFPAEPIAGARIEVTPGTIGATADSAGDYRLYGVPPDATIRATAVGYEPLVQVLGLGTNAKQNFQLAPSGPRRFAGNYTLAVDAFDPCSSLDTQPLHMNLQHRRYDAVLTQNGLIVEVVLTEPRFRVSDGRGNHFSGRVDATGATFTLAYYDPGDHWSVEPTYPDVAERLSDGTYLVVAGTAVTRGSAAGLSGTLDSMNTWDSTFPANGRQLAGCSGIRFTLTPR